MITRYGMSDEFDMVAMETVTNQYLGGDTSLACSAETQALIDKKVVELVRAQHQKALSILQENKRKMDELAEYLYFRETITGEEFMKILTRKPMPREIPMNGSISDEEADYVSDTEDTAFTTEAQAGVDAESESE
jgi:cell division protease FtsH